LAQKKTPAGCCGGIVIAEKQDDFDLLPRSRCRVFCLNAVG
jgi:hypothetical protein